jgi:hypothetical protein
MGSDTLNVAVFIGTDLQSGGGYQYEYMELKILKKFHENNAINFSYYALNRNVLHEFSEIGVSIQIINEKLIQKILRVCLSNSQVYRFLSKIGLKRSKIETPLKQDNIDIAYFLSPTGLVQGLGNIPFIFTLWDLGHLQHLEFPEISYNRNFESR